MMMIPKVTNKQTNITFLSIRDLAESSPRPCCSGSKALLSEVFRDFLIIIIIIQCTAVVKQCNVIPWAKLLTKALLKKVFRDFVIARAVPSKQTFTFIYDAVERFYFVTRRRSSMTWYVLKTRRGSMKWC